MQKMRQVLKRFAPYILIGGVALILFATEALGVTKLFDMTHREIVQCDEHNEIIDAKINCWYEILRDKVRSEGVVAAYEAFDDMYEYSDVFVSMSCHEHAHVIGDTAYYEQYLTHKDLEKMKFPVETAHCGYGFWHGFVEHLVQDSPDPAFVDETCAYLTNRLEGKLSDIELTCYHAAGHGFMLAPIDTADRGEWGDFHALVREPLANCDALETTDFLVEECKIGIFNVIGRWMFDEEYELTYDLSDPFKECRALAERNQLPCYNEMAQKLDSASDWNIVKAATFVADIENDRWAGKVFGVGVASMMLKGITEESEFAYVKQCREIPIRLHEQCLQSVVAGLMEYGNPNEEWRRAERLCFSDAVLPEEKRICYEMLLTKNQRFYSDDKVARLCKRSEEFAEYCRRRGVEL